MTFVKNWAVNLHNVGCLALILTYHLNYYFWLQVNIIYALNKPECFCLPTLTGQTSSWLITVTWSITLPGGDSHASMDASVRELTVWSYLKQVILRFWRQGFFIKLWYKTMLSKSESVCTIKSSKVQNSPITKRIHCRRHPIHWKMLLSIYWVVNSNFAEVGKSVGCVICGRTLHSALSSKWKRDLLKQSKVFKDGSTKVERTTHVYGETATKVYFHTTSKKYKEMLEVYQLRITKRQTLWSE